MAMRFIPNRGSVARIPTPARHQRFMSMMGSVGQMSGPPIQMRPGSTNVGGMHYMSVFMLKPGINQLVAQQEIFATTM